MYRSILVPLDGSPASEVVLAQLPGLAGEGAEIHLLTVAETPAATATVDQPLTLHALPLGAEVTPAVRTLEDKSQAMERVRDQLTTYLAARADELRRKELVVITGVAYGDPAEEIVAYACEHEIDAIMMATHGRTALSQVVFGSVAARVVATGVRPVLLVRPHSLGGEQR